jgi:hypothetical protein
MDSSLGMSLITAVCLMAVCAETYQSRKAAVLWGRVVDNNGGFSPGTFV